MKKVLVIASLVIVFASACSKDRLRVNGKGDIVTTERTVSDFNSLKLTMEADVVWHHSTDPKIEIVAQSNIAEVIETRQRGNEIIIEVQPLTSIRSHKTITVHLFSPEAKRVEVTGSGDVRVLDELDGSDFEVNITGSGDIVLENDVEESLEATVTGSGDFRVESDNKCDNAKFKITGSGDIDAVSIPANRVEIQITGSGDAKVNVTDRLEARISGSGDIRYKGNPSLQTTITGSGSVKQL